MQGLSRSKDGEKDDCRGLSPEKTVRCASPGVPTPSVEQALSVWRCESNWGVEKAVEMGHSYHGPFQYLYSTYESQQRSMPDVVEWYELVAGRHDMRSNMLTAIAYASRHGWTGTWVARERREVPETSSRFDVAWEMASTVKAEVERLRKEVRAYEMRIPSMRLADQHNQENALRWAAEVERLRKTYMEPTSGIRPTRDQAGHGRGRGRAATG